MGKEMGRKSPCERRFESSEPTKESIFRAKLAVSFREGNH